MATPVLGSAAVTQFRSGFRGALIEPGDASYEESRKVYNAMIDRRPRVIARCADVADVIAAVHFGREHGLRVAIRGGGHNGGGLGVCDEGLVIDLSPMKYVRVDPANGQVRVGGGCTLGDVDHATRRVRARRAGRRHLDHRRGRVDAGRRPRAPHAKVRPHHRQPRLRRRRARGRPVRGGQPRSGAGSVLGHSWRRRQLRRGDVVPVPGAARASGDRGADALESRGRSGGDALVPPVHRERAGRRQRVLRVPGGAARPAVPRGTAQANRLRHRVVLHWAGTIARRRRSRPRAPSRRQSWSSSDRCPSPRSRRCSIRSCRRACSGTGGRTS